MRSPRITAMVRKDSDGKPAEVVLYLNSAGRHFLVKVLLLLDARLDQLHMLFGDENVPPR